MSSLTFPHARAITAPPLPFDEWLDTADERPRWVVPDLLRADSFMLISGPPKSMKTYFILSMAVALASGKSFGGWQAPDTEDLGPIFLIEEEGGSGNTVDRFRAICNAMEVDPCDLTNRLFIYWKRSFRLDKEVFVHDLMSDIATAKPSLVIADPLFHLMSGDENKAEAIRPVIEAGQKITVEGSSFALVHHTKKRIKDFVSRPDEMLRGSSAIAGAYDQHVYMQPASEKGGRVVHAIRMGREEQARSETFVWQFDQDDQSVVSSLHLDRLEGHLTEFDAVKATS